MAQSQLPELLELPDDVLVGVLVHLDLHTVRNVALSSKRLAATTQSEAHWLLRTRQLKAWTEAAPSQSENGGGGNNGAGDGNEVQVLARGEPEPEEMRPPPRENARWFFPPQVNTMRMPNTRQQQQIEQPQGLATTSADEAEPHLSQEEREEREHEQAVEFSAGALVDDHTTREQIDRELGLLLEGDLPERDGNNQTLTNHDDERAVISNVSNMSNVGGGEPSVGVRRDRRMRDAFRLMLREYFRCRFCDQFKAGQRKTARLVVGCRCVGFSHVRCINKKRWASSAIPLQEQFTRVRRAVRNLQNITTWLRDRPRKQDIWIVDPLPPNSFPSEFILWILRILRNSPVLHRVFLCTECRSSYHLALRPRACLFQRWGPRKLRPMKLNENATNTDISSSNITDSSNRLSDRSSKSKGLMFSWLYRRALIKSILDGFDYYNEKISAKLRTKPDALYYFLCFELLKRTAVIWCELIPTAAAHVALLSFLGWKRAFLVKRTEEAMRAVWPWKQYKFMYFSPQKPYTLRTYWKAYWRGARRLFDLYEQAMYVMFGEYADAVFVQTCTMGVGLVSLYIRRHLHNLARGLVR